MTKTLYVINERIWEIAKLNANVRGESLGRYVEAALAYYDQRSTQPCEKCEQVRRILNEDVN